MKSIILGIIIGIILFTITSVSIGANIVSKVKVDYSDEARAVIHVLEQTKEPLLQPDYILSGLNFSGQFQEYLQEGVSDGWWTEEYITQVLTDDLFPIYGKTLYSVLNFISKETGISLEDILNKIKSIIPMIKEILPKIKEVINKLDLQQVLALLTKIRNKILSLDINHLMVLMQKVKGIISSLNLEQINILINKIKDINLEDKINSIKSKIEDLKNKIEDLKNKINSIDIDIEDLKNKIEDIKDKINSMDIDIEDLKNKIEDIKDKINNIDINAIKNKIEDLIDDISSFVDNIKSIIQNLIDEINNFFANIILWLNSDVSDDGIWNKLEKLDSNPGNGQLEIGTLQIPLQILQSADIYINYYFDENESSGGVVGDITDDEIAILDISVTFERFIMGMGDGEGFRVVKHLNPNIIMPNTPKTINFCLANLSFGTCSPPFSSLTIPWEITPKLLIDIINNTV